MTRSMKTLGFGLLASLLFLSEGQQSEAAVLDYKPLAMEVQKGDRLVIQGFEGRVKLVGNNRNNAKDIVINLKQDNPANMSAEGKAVLDEWLFSLQRKGEVIEVAIRSPQSKQVWSKLLMSGGMPQFYMEISAPPIPAEVTWRKGTVSIENWNDTLSVHVLEGETRVVGGKGEAQVVHQDGTLVLSGREGNVSVESFKGTLTVAKVKGKLDVENFSGTSRISDVDGQLNVTSTSGTMKISDSKGRLDFHNLRANLVIDDFSGELRGRNGAGSVSASVKGEADVRIHSKEGGVSLRLPNSAARVNLGTAEGNMALPNYLHVSRLPNLRWVRGRLRGDVKGSVYVRTNEGNIRLR
ncbi:MAG: DUF4097 family beta strand repeat protein [Bdellovibrionaceae bacterium]|nr:DUF4097 family beta strand repeat protein [Bdellovibrionales bacterium]MCB9083660.1 DUF4097 family beta strand repeat protein [Pseudobdellovibrionaceae bacterium]